MQKTAYVLRISDWSSDVCSSDLRSRLPIDARGRTFVHVFMLSHPDQDHCSGLRRHFWLGPITDYPDDDLKQNEKRIVIHESWDEGRVGKGCVRTCRSWRSP